MYSYFSTQPRNTLSILGSGPLLPEQSVSLCIFNCSRSCLTCFLFLDFQSSLPILLHSITDTDLLYKLPKLTAAWAQNLAFPHSCLFHSLQHPDQHSPLQRNHQNMREFGSFYQLFNSTPSRLHPLFLLSVRKGAFVLRETEVKHFAPVTGQQHDNSFLNPNPSTAAHCFQQRQYSLQQYTSCSSGQESRPITHCSRCCCTD